MHASLAVTFMMTQISGLLSSGRTTYAQCLAAAKDVVALRGVEQPKVDEFRHILQQVPLSHRRMRQRDLTLGPPLAPKER